MQRLRKSSPNSVRLGAATALLTTLFAGCASVGDLSSDSDVTGTPTAQSATSQTARVAALPVPASASTPAVVANKPAPKHPSTSAAAHRDLWDRIRAGFAMPELDTPLVAEKERFYTSKPEYLQRMFGRGERYLFYIVEELERRGMPTELALLPFVESAMNPVAVSSAKAAGLWQFIPSTGKAYNLHQNWWVDNRRDPVKSTHAALDYLQRIYEMQGNDWFLALASYNWGEGSVARAMRKNELRGRPTDYLSLDMPAETRHYVPKLIALKHILLRAGELGVALPALPNQPYFVTIEKTRPIDLKLAAKFAGMSVDEFVALNPAHNRPVISANRNNQIKLPADRVDAFLAAVERHQKTDKPLASWQPYTLKAGESLETVAQNAGLAAGELRKANSLRDTQRVVAGTRILAPQSRVEDETKVETFVAPRVYEQVDKPAVYHTVQRHESLATISQRYGLSAATLSAWNGIKRGVKRGMRLLVQPAATQTLLTNEEGDRSIVASATKAGFVRVSASVDDQVQAAPRRATIQAASVAPAAPAAPAAPQASHRKSAAKAAPASRTRVVARPAASVPKQVAGKTTARAANKAEPRASKTAVRAEAKSRPRSQGVRAAGRGAERADSSVRRQGA